MEGARTLEALQSVPHSHHNRSCRQRRLMGLAAATLVVVPVVASARVAGAEPTNAPVRPAASEPVLLLPAAVSKQSLPPAPAPDPTQPLVDFAIAQVGAPYRFAASGQSAFDCSGLTMAAYRELGIELPHKSERQVDLGQSVDWSTEPIKPGDLIFTAGSRPVHAYGHVGLAISDSEWVVAPNSGSVVTREPIPFDRVDAVRRVLDVPTDA